VSTAPSEAATGPPQRRRPPGRYDDPSRTTARVIAVLLSLLFVAVLAAVAVALFNRYGTERIALQERGFEVQSDRAVRVDFSVSPPPGETAWCIVRARSAAGVEVGAQYVPVRQTAAVREPVQVSSTLPTSERAVTGEVPRCALAAPPEGEPTAQPDP
jgi:hypothetical protein